MSREDYGLLYLVFLIILPIMIGSIYLSTPDWGWGIVAIGFGVLFASIPIYATIKEIKQKKARKKRKEEMRKAKQAFEKEQRKKGLIKFIDSIGKERWGTPEQVQEWKAIDIGLSNNFADYTPYKFEEFIAELFMRMGYHAHTTPYSKDYGVDVLAQMGENTIAIQVKKYARGNNVGAKEVQQTLGAMWKVKAEQAIIVTTSGFTVYAREQAKGAPIELWGKTKLHEMVRKYFIES